MCKTLTLLHYGILFCTMWCLGIFFILRQTLKYHKNPAKPCLRSNTIYIYIYIYMCIKYQNIKWLTCIMSGPGPL